MKILLTGGSGLIGTHLTTLLLQQGYQVAHLTTSQKPNPNPQIKTYQWHIDQKKIDVNAFEGVDFLVHMAGEGIADKAWTKQRKKELYNSRIDGTKLITDTLKTIKHQLKGVIALSAIGFYATGSQIVDEKSGSGNDFMAKICEDWEKEHHKFEKDLNLRTVIVRIGVVMAKEGGALPKIAQPIRFFAGTALGSGSQMVSWIHVEDVCRLILFAIENRATQGIFNAVASQPVSNETLTKAIGKAINKPILLPNVPAFALRLALGEMASVVLDSHHVSNKKIEQAGFKFNYDNIESALKNLLST